MAQVSKAFYQIMKDEKLRAEDAARKLGVSRASFYKYLRKEDLPRLEVLRRANHLWGKEFTYAGFALDNEFFENLAKEPGPPKEEQIPLPFIEGLRNEDIKILEVIPRKPNAVELKLRIQFAGQTAR
jgi:transcriptional regulator with XRE-family HTH domain